MVQWAYQMVQNDSRHRQDYVVQINRSSKKQSELQQTYGR